MTALRGFLRRVRRRQRIADAAYALARFALPGGLLIAAALLVGIRRFDVDPTWLWSSAAAIPVLIAWAWIRPLPDRVIARRVDDHYGLQDALGSALELSARSHTASDRDPRTPAIIALVIANAHAHSAELDPRPVVPLRLPAPRRLDAIAVVAVLAAALIPPARAQPLRPVLQTVGAEAIVRATARTGLDLSLADPLRQDLRGLTQGDDTSAEIAARILEILDELERGELDRAAAFAELEALEDALADAEQRLEAELEDDPGMLADALRELAEALEQHEVTDDAAKSLRDGDPDRIEAAFDDAAQAAADPAAARDLQKAMKAAERRLGEAAKASPQTARDLDDAERRLRKEQKRKADDPAEQERRLKKLQRRVEELRRKHEREKAASRRLEQLRRNAQNAANGGASGAQRKQATKRMGKNAGDASRASRRSSRLTRSRDGLQEAKTMVRRAGKQGENDKRRREQFKKFSDAAKGKRGKQGKDGKNGKGKSTLLVEGRVGEGEPAGLMEMTGDGQDGDGQDRDGQDGDGSGQPHQADGSSTMAGDGMGEGSVDPLGGEGDDPGFTKKNLQVGARSGRGVSRAEVIRESSQQGFATEAYHDVYTDYRGFAQSALDSEAIPAAKRRTVKRYYQLIQPRD